MSETKPRIAILDGFRAVAILAVMFFHFFSRWIPPRNPGSLYPYNNKYDFFQHGNLGVQFFFIISGFVIFFTLDTTNKFITFWEKRAIRLLPSIIIASIITFIVLSLFDHSFLFYGGHEVWNFLPSITFIAPQLLNHIFHSNHFDYINGSYWSLWPEVQFYFFSSVLFFLNKEKFVKHFIACSAFFIVINYVMGNIMASNKLGVHLPVSFLNGYVTWTGIFNLLSYLPFFSVGVLFYLLFKNKKYNYKTSLGIKIFVGIFLAYMIYSGVRMEVRMIYLVMILLFFGFIYYPEKLSFFQNKILTTIGVSSYFLYLIHEDIGVLLIHSLGHYFMPLGFIFTLLLMCFITLFSILYTEKVDKKINTFLKRKVDA